MSSTPSGRRGEIWRYVHICNVEGYSPSLDEIGKACGGISKATVWEHVRLLERDGWLNRRGPRLARGLLATTPAELVPDGPSF